VRWSRVTGGHVAVVAGCSGGVAVVAGCRWWGHGGRRLLLRLEMGGVKLG